MITLKKIESLSTTRILLIQDSQNTRVARALELDGFDVRIVTSARQAVHAIAGEWFDVLVCETQSPEICELVRNLAAQRIRAIALTDASDPRVRQKLHDAGFALCLDKDLAGEQLQNALADLLAPSL